MKSKFIFILILLMLISCQNKTGDYVCKSFNLPCDELTYNESEICPHCKMNLIKKSELIPEKELTLNEINIQNGRDFFLIEGSFQVEKSIVIHYCKPTNIKSDSSILIVLSGAVRDREINEERTAMTGFKISKNPNKDFDRIFNYMDFSKNLVLLLGEKDNTNETRGDLKRSSEVDKKSLHKFERGTYFYSELNSELNWKFHQILDTILEKSVKLQRIIYIKRKNVQ